MPLNTHGGLLSYGHCGVGGAMAYLVETVRQMRGEVGGRQVARPPLALLHGDGGVLSSQAPYRIALVDAEEGFRFMMHAAEGLAIGDAVTTTFRPFGERIVPLVEPRRS